MFTIVYPYILIVYIYNNDLCFKLYLFDLTMRGVYIFYNFVYFYLDFLYFVHIYGYGIYYLVKDLVIWDEVILN